MCMWQLGVRASLVANGLSAGVPCKQDVCEKLKTMVHPHLSLRWTTLAEDNFEQFCKCRSGKTAVWTSKAVCAEEKTLRFR